MKKVTALLIAFVFAIFTTAVYADGVALTDAEMDEIAAGNWVVIGETEEVVDVYYNNNTLELIETSQQDISGVSNANIIDSAVAIQYNIASVTGDNAPTNNVAVNGTNEAIIDNYNPSEEWSDFLFTSETKIKNTEHWLNTSENHVDHFTKSWSFVSDFDETLDITEDFNAVLAVAAAGAWRDKAGRHDEALAIGYAETYDYVLDYDKTHDITEIHNETRWIDWLSTVTEHWFESSTDIDVTESGSFHRTNKSENNHIFIEDEAQKDLKVVSNLNSVGSGVAVQQNIATNVGVSGSITHANFADVSNGL